jgi:hypothetical protein
LLRLIDDMDGSWFARGRRGDVGGSGRVDWLGEEGGDSPASRNTAAGSFQNCSCSFSEFQTKCRSKTAAVDDCFVSRLMWMSGCLYVQIPQGESEYSKRTESACRQSPAVIGPCNRHHMASSLAVLLTSQLCNQAGSFDIPSILGLNTSYTSGSDSDSDHQRLSR